MRSNRMFWAVILVLLGLLFLANNLGFLDISVWNFFWPAFLILLGIWFLVGSTRKSSPLVVEEGSVELGDAKSASVVVKHGAGRLSIDGSAESGKLVSGSFANGLDARVKRDGEALDVVLQPRSPVFPDVVFPWHWAAGRGFEWNCGLTREIPLNLSFEIGAVEAYIDLSELKVKDLKLSTGASSTNLTLPAGAGMTHFKVEAGAASVKIKVPEGVAARIETSAGLASVSVDQSRFPKSNGYYQSADYEGAKNKVEIRIETGVASIEIQ
jgi:hypothetical protein